RNFPHFTSRTGRGAALLPAEQGVAVVPATLRVVRRDLEEAVDRLGLQRHDPEVGIEADLAGKRVGDGLARLAVQPALEQAAAAVILVEEALRRRRIECLGAVAPRLADEQRPAFGRPLALDRGKVAAGED